MLRGAINYVAGDDHVAGDCVRFINAPRQQCGHSAVRSEMLHMARSSSRERGPSSLRKAGVMSSAPGAPLRRILPIAAFNSSIVKIGIVSAPLRDRINFFKARLILLSFLLNLRWLAFA